MGSKKTFSPAQLAHYKRAFSLYDLNRDGYIECRELQAIGHYLGYRLNEHHVFKIMRRLDVDEKGVLSFEQFLQAMPGNTEVLTEEDHRKALYRQKFQEYDKSNVGHVTSLDAKRVLQEELNCLDSQLDLLLEHFHMEDKQHISYDDFVNFYCKVLERKEDIRKAFQEFDKENKGYVSFEDAQRIMADYGFSDSELMALFNVHDRNKDNMLNFQEFVGFWGLQV